MSASSHTLATESLRLALRQWCEALDALRITVQEDQPAPGELALADRMADDTDEVIGWLSEASAGLDGANDFSDAHRLVGRALRKQGESLFGCVRQIHLEQLARGADLRWRAWVSAVRSALEPLWLRSEDVVTRLAFPFPPPASMAPPRVDPFQDRMTLNQSN